MAHDRYDLGRVVTEAFRGLVAIGWIAALTFVILSPYALIDMRNFVDDIVVESMMVRGLVDFPYTRQYIGTPPYLYQITQAITWSMGIPMGIVGFAGVAGALVTLYRRVRGTRWLDALLLAVPMTWFLVYFGITGAFHAKFLRYMLPLLPLLCLWGAALLLELVRQHRAWLRWAGRVLGVVTLLGSSLYVIAYLAVYAAAHPWEQATDWMCSNIPVGRALMIEHWDQPLPILQGVGQQACWIDYRYSVFPAYDPDDSAKLGRLVAALQSVDYIVIASNRLYGSITRLPGRYPIAARYYRQLFAEELGFELVYVSQVYPRIGPVRLVNDTLGYLGLDTPPLLAGNDPGSVDLVLGYADESYSVYDHPMPLIFRRTMRLSRAELLERLSPDAGSLSDAP